MDSTAVFGNSDHDFQQLYTIVQRQILASFIHLANWISKNPEILSIIMLFFICAFVLFVYFKYIRIHLTIEVNCWFCNKNSRTKYENKNSFVCPFCHQYNGFGSDGGYNRVIQSQHSASLNHTANHYFSTFEKSSKSEPAQNGFCKSCNTKLLLKVRTLAQVSSDVLNTGQKVEDFRESLEEIYALCQQCQAVLTQTLGKEDVWLKPKLVAWRLSQTKDKLMKMSKEKYKIINWKIVNKCCLFISVTMCFLASWRVLPSDVNLMTIPLTFAPSVIDVLYSIFLCIYLFINLLYFLMPKHKVKVISLVTCGFLPILLIEWLNYQNKKQLLDQFKILFNFVNLTIVFLCVNILCSLENKKITKNPMDRTPLNSKTLPDQKSDYGYNSSRPSTPLLYSAAPSLVSEDKEMPELEIDSDLLSLKISTPKKNAPTINPDSSSARNFFLGKPVTKKGNRNVVQSSKFGNNLITQSSWVAGGYWGSPKRLTRQSVSQLEKEQIPTFSLSRSSSQSSGYVSLLSECPSSKSQTLPVQNSSQATSLNGEGAGGFAPYSIPKQNFSNTSPLGSTNYHNLENWEMHSACTASSICSNDSQLRHRNSIIRNVSPSPSVCSNSCYLRHPDEFVVNQPNQIITKTMIEPSYFNLGMAFFLGISLSANLFFVGILLIYSG